MSLEDLIYKFALFNASQYGGKVNPGSVMGKLISEIPEVKNKPKKTMEIIQRIKKEVESIPLYKQKSIIKKKYSSLLEKKEKKSQTLPEIKNTKNLKMRFAPNPNGPLSLGHSRTLLLNWFYIQKYKGELILRFDDTDPKNKVPQKEAYRWIQEDITWLEIEPKVIVKAAQRLDIYYDYAKKLIKMGKAYVCDCNTQNWRELIRKKKGCKCRDLTPSVQIDRWNKMFSQYKEGDAILRIKTDLTHKNPAVRDWPAFRIVDNPIHPYKEAKVWPLYNFASAIDDHEFKITHIIRGIDLNVAEARQKYIYNYFKWKYPKSLLNGKLKVRGIKSTSQAKKMIESGELEGWSDPRLATLMAFRRRGVTKKAIYEFIKSLGLKKSDIDVSIENLASINRKILDENVDRYHFVLNPYKLNLKLRQKTVELKYHPDRDKTRSINLDGPIYISEDDYKKYKGKNIRLKDLISLKLDREPKILENIDHKNLQKIQWVVNPINIDVVMPDGNIISGFGESDIKKLKKGDIIQLVRFGFAKLDKIKDDKIIFYYAHN